MAISESTEMQNVDVMTNATALGASIVRKLAGDAIAASPNDEPMTEEILHRIVGLAIVSNLMIQAY